MAFFPSVFNGAKMRSVINTATSRSQPITHHAQLRFASQKNKQRVTVPPRVPLEGNVAIIHQKVFITVAYMVRISRGNPRMPCPNCLWKIDICVALVECWRTNGPPRVQNAISVLVNGACRIVLQQSQLFILLFNKPPRRRLFRGAVLIG